MSMRVAARDMLVGQIVEKAHMDLPESWRAAIKFCPHCRGTGVREGKYDAKARSHRVWPDCEYCNGSGDLFATMLLDAYARGRQHVLDGLREVEAVRKLAVERLAREQPTGDELKRAMGL